MSWFLAPALVQLRAEINARWPGRDTTTDGSVGDLAHRNRGRSDHNPDSLGRVDAIDVDENPARGSSREDVGQGIWKMLQVAKPVQLKYAIYEGQMLSSYAKGSYPPYTPRPYRGANPHRGHIHISVLDDHAMSRKPWGLANVTSQTQEDDVELVKNIQQALNDAGFPCGKVDGKWGNLTQTAFTKALAAGSAGGAHTHDVQVVVK